MFKHFFILVLFLSCGLQASGQQASTIIISWDVLKDVKFSEKYSKEYEVEYDHPTFGPKVKKLESRKIQIRGYVIPLDASTYVLSANPMASCFFCGGAGPESIIQLKFSQPQDLNVDRIITVQGFLQLNYDNLQELNYIMESVSLL